VGWREGEEDLGRGHSLGKGLVVGMWQDWRGPKAGIEELVRVSGPGFKEKKQLLRT
jgi:hypothetical protein